MKISEKSQRDFEFYSTFPVMCGVEVIPSNWPEGHASALEAFVFFDSTGKKAPCKDIAALRRAFVGKASVNLQIKMWAEDLFNCPILLVAELREYTKDMPEWVFRATIMQAQKLSLEQLGFVGKHLKV